ncbi:MAG: hypothetical protein ACREV6_15470 [Clostridium sp.]|uniref:hypothetical protein n=1 Tax=Clostridium sp. TaxID=1506 RepID=UPI003D6D9129
MPRGWHQYIFVDAVEDTMRHCPDRKVFGSDIERQLDIIKYLQGTAKTKEMLVNMI